MKATVHTMAGSLRRRFTTWNRCLSALRVCVFTHIFLLFVGSLGPPVSREPRPTMAMAICLRPGREESCRGCSSGMGGVQVAPLTLTDG